MITQMDVTIRLKKMTAKVKAQLELPHVKKLSNRDCD